MKWHPDLIPYWAYFQKGIDLYADLDMREVEFEKEYFGDSDKIVFNPPKGDNIKELLKANAKVSFVPMTNVNEELGQIAHLESRYIKDVISGSYRNFENGDILFAKVTPCMENGNCAIAENLENGVGFGSSEFYVFRCLDEVSNVYVWHYLRRKALRNAAKETFKGAGGLKRVPKKFFVETYIPIPKPFRSYSSLQIQKAILDFVHFYENDHEGSLELTRNVTEPSTEMNRLIVPLIFQKHYTVDFYFDGYCSRKGIDLKFEDVKFDYPVLDEVFDTVRRGASPRPIKKYIVPENYTGEKYNWLKIGDVTASGKYLNKTKKFINADGKDKSVLGKKGDFLITNSMTIGVPIILNIPVCFHDGFLYLGFDSNEQINYNKDYLYYFFEYNRHRLKYLSKSGVVNNLNTEIIREVQIPIPKSIPSKLTSYELQEIIVDFIEDFKQYHQAKIDHYQNIQDRISDVVYSILKHAFSPQ